jgi:hypothetical protein
MNILGLDATKISVYEVSDNLTRMVLETKKGNGYAVYHYKDDGKVFANWKMGLLEGKEKEDMLAIFNRYKNKRRSW